MHRLFILQITISEPAIQYEVNGMHLVSSNDKEIRSKEIKKQKNTEIW